MEKSNISKAERGVYIAAGAMLAASGINNMFRSPGKFFTKCIVGFYLIKVGKSGYSHVNDWLDINTAGQSPRQALETYKEEMIGAFAAPVELIEEP